MAGHSYHEGQLKVTVPLARWQRPYVPFNVFTHNEQMEKLGYMHSDPVSARLVASPDQWLWSSFRFCYLNDSSVLTMDRVR